MQSESELIWEAHTKKDYREFRYAIEEYVDNARVTPGLLDAVTNLSKDSRFAYNGPAYRAIYFPFSQVELPIEELLRISKTNPTNQSIFAWSKSIEGMECAMGHAHDDDSLPYPLGIVLYCPSIRAIDVNKLLPNRPRVMQDEHEILSIEQSNYEVVGYMDTFGILTGREEFLERLKDYLES